MRSPYPVPPLCAVSPAMMLRPGDPFGAGELSALVRDGVVVPALCDLHLPAGTPLTRAVKLMVLRHLLPGNLRMRGVVGRLGAAWFYDCAPAPSPVPVLVDKAARTTSVVPEGFSMHQTVFGPGHHHEHQGVRITTPLRTCMDIALHVPGRDGDRAVESLMSRPWAQCSPERVLEAFGSLGRVPGRRAAMARIRILGHAVAGAHQERDHSPADG